MSVFGYVYLALEKEQLVAKELQQQALLAYCQSIYLEIEDLVVEEGASLKRPFKDRAEGRKLIDRCLAGDMIIVMKAEWVLSSAAEGLQLLKLLRKRDISLYCLDLGANISVDEKRKLVVSEGSAGIVQKLLSALAVCEASSHGQAIKATKRNLKKQGKYLGGPVPFGWEVNKDRMLVEKAAEQKVIEEIITMRKDRWSYRDISKKLKDEFDIELSHAGVRRVLESNKKKKAAFAAAKIGD